MPNNGAKSWGPTSPWKEMRLSFSVQPSTIPQALNDYREVMGRGPGNDRARAGTG